MRLFQAEKVTLAFYKLAQVYDGQDPFYLAALNIACGTDPARREAILADFDKHFPEWNDKVADLVFELRPKSTLARLDKLLVDPKLTAAQKARIVDILATSDSVDAGKTVLGLLTGEHAPEVKTRALGLLRQFLPGKWRALHTENDRVLTMTTDRLLSDKATVVTGLQLVAAAADPKWFGWVKTIVNDDKASKEVRAEAVRTLGRLQTTDVAAFLREVKDPSLKLDAIKALAALSAGQAKDGVADVAMAVLKSHFNDDAAGADLRQAALEAMAGTPAGTRWLLDLQRNGKFPAELASAAGRLLRNSPFQGERNRALILFPAAGKLDPKTLPSPAELAKKWGNAEAGKAIFAKSATSDAQCMKCHAVRGQGGQIGPDLSMIGKKGSKENLFESILQPSKAIADQYVTWKVETTDGQAITGLLVQETPEAITIRDANGKDHVVPAKNVEKEGKKKLATSLMADDLAKSLTEQDLVDLVAYMATLQSPAYTPESWHMMGPFLRAADVKAGIMHDFGPVAGTFDLKATFPEWNGPSSGPKAKSLGWTVVRPGADGMVGLLPAEAGKVAVNYAYKSIESLGGQDVTLLLGYQGQARVWANGVMVHSTTPGRKDTDGPDTTTFTLRRGANPVFVKFASDAANPGFTFTLLSGQELKGK